jgi:hypothetical protein
MAELKEISILISETRPDERGSEGVYAVIRNDFAKDSAGEPIFDKEFSYQMEGIFLHAPIPKEVRGGFASAADAESTARQELTEWRTGNIPPDTQVTRQENWNMQYYSNPYLQHLTQDEFNERFADIQNNLLTLTETRQIGIVPMDDVGDYWSAAFSHVIAESGLRGGFQGNWKEKLSFPDYDWVGIDKVSPVVNRLNLQKGKFLVKYGAEEWMRAAYENGEIRIAPASSYKDSSLNRAIRDDELELSIKPHFRDGKNAALEQLEHDLKNPVSPSGNGVEILKAPTDYYVYCLGSNFSLRMFPDFEADTCLVITKPQLFIERLIRAVLTQIPDWNGFGIGVNYIDPVNVTKDEIDIFYSKNFRYAYQKEYRLIWTPPTPTFNLKPIFVKLGNLSDCCEFIALNHL